MSIYGELDTANECLKRMSGRIARDWDEGTVRYRKEDIERARKYIREIGRISANIRTMIKQFDGIVLLKENGKIK